MGGRWEGNSKEGTYVHPWLIYADVWQNQTNIVNQFINQLKTNKCFKKYSLFDMLLVYWNNEN